MKTPKIDTIVRHIDTITRYALRAYDSNRAPWRVQGMALAVRTRVDLAALRELTDWITTNQQIRGKYYQGERRAVLAAQALQRIPHTLEQQLALHRAEIARRLSQEAA